MKKPVLTIAVFVFIALLLVGCSKGLFRSDSEPESIENLPPPSPPQSAELPRASLMGMVFEDIDIPFELHVVEDESIMIDARSYVVGALTYTGEVSVESVLGFFKSQMPKRGWEFIASSYAKKNVILAFSQPGKHCVIYVYSSSAWQGSVKVQIFVGDTNAKPPMIPHR